MTVTESLATFSDDTFDVSTFSVATFDVDSVFSVVHEDMINEDEIIRLINTNIFIIETIRGLFVKKS